MGGTHLSHVTRHKINRRTTLAAINIIGPSEALDLRFWPAADLCQMHISKLPPDDPVAMKWLLFADVDYNFLSVYMQYHEKWIYLNSLDQFVSFPMTQPLRDTR